jgi:hypothetical protein
MTTEIPDEQIQLLGKYSLVFQAILNDKTMKRSNKNSDIKIIIDSAPNSDT